MTPKWKTLAEAAQGRLTPMLRQFIDAKAQSGNSLLFFRMGDFYELFFEDAIDAAEAIGLTLTSRDGDPKDKKGRIPMAGVPVRSVDAYVAKLLKLGRTVTICDQVENPKDAKGVVKRAVVRTVTPGTLTEPELLNETTNNYLGAIWIGRDCGGVALADVSTGEFLAAQLNGDTRQSVDDELVRMAPAEVLIPDTMDARDVDELNSRFPAIQFTLRPDDTFDLEFAGRELRDAFDLATLKGLELDDAPEAVRCAGATFAYIQETQRETAPYLRPPRRYSPGQYVVLDGNTQRNLELVESLRDKSRHGTLLNVLDKTRTSMGSRMLRRWLLHPLVAVDTIRGRLDAVAELVDNAETRLRLREALQGVADLERLLSRLTSQAGNARDLAALGRSVQQIPDVKAALKPCSAAMLVDLRDNTDPLEDVASLVAGAIIDEPPATISDGGLMKDGYDAELDRLRELVRGGRDWIATLQKGESERTGIPNLKVRYNKVFGYYIEVSNAHVNKVPDDYERKQTLVNAERYVTPTLKSREEEIVNAQENLNELEYELFVALRKRVAQEAARIQAVAEAIAATDVLLSFAEVAATNDYVRPEIDTSGVLDIRDGRHPVVEELVPRGTFVPNDATLDSDSAQIQIVTGPNMAGKSTYLRQVALITLMGQIGSFVPAASAHIGVVDRIFTRVGASDNLARGESTFMVEMIETAAILNCATRASLVVLDEIGRGTSTFDGISIAWAVAEHLHDRIGAKTLFATHYHELTQLANNMERVQNLNVSVREWDGKVVFLYRLAAGGADHSYGIQVAKLAGLPAGVIDRARGILELLESGNAQALGLHQQLSLFVSEDSIAPRRAEKTALESLVEKADPDAMSPRDAHEFLYSLKKAIEKNE